MIVNGKRCELAKAALQRGCALPKQHFFLPFFKSGKLPSRDGVKGVSVMLIGCSSVINSCGGRLRVGAGGYCVWDKW